MAYTGHGHYIMGSRKTGIQPKFKSRCYGDYRCTACKTDIDNYWKKHGADPEKEEGVEVVMLGDTIRQKKAMTIVENYVIGNLSEEEKGTKVEAYVLKLTRIRDNWKALLTCNTNPDLLYEIVYLANLKVSKIRVFAPTAEATVQDDVD